MEQELTKSRCSWVNTITGTTARPTWGGWTSPRLSTTRITTATPSIMTSLFSGWPPRLNGVPTPTSDQPVCLSMVLETMISGCPQSGWGTTSSGGSVSNVLLEVDVKVISNSECNNAYGGITDNMLCAADASGNGGSDAC